MTPPKAPRLPQVGRSTGSPAPDMGSPGCVAPTSSGGAHYVGGREICRVCGKPMAWRREHEALRTEEGVVDAGFALCWEHSDG